MPIVINGQSYPSTINEASTEMPHGTYYMADNREVYELQRSNSFEFIITDLDNLRPSGDPSLTPTWSNPQQALRLSVNESFVPHFTQQELTVRRGNSTLYYAGMPEFQNGSINFTDFIGAQTLDILMAWQNLSYNVTTEKIGVAGDYKKDCYLVEYTPDWQIVRTWKLYGCWITSISEQPFNHESNDKRMISVTIRYDRAKIDMTNTLEGNSELISL